MHVGGRSGADIDAGGVLPTFTGFLVRDGYRMAALIISAFAAGPDPATGGART
jgi:transposase